MFNLIIQSAAIFFVVISLVFSPLLRYNRTWLGVESLYTLIKYCNQVLKLNREVRSDSGAVPPLYEGAFSVMPLV